MEIGRWRDEEKVIRKEMEKERGGRGRKRGGIEKEKGKEEYKDGLEEEKREN